MQKVKLCVMCLNRLNMHLLMQKLCLNGIRKFLYNIEIYSINLQEDNTYPSYNGFLSYFKKEV